MNDKNFSVGDLVVLKSDKGLDRKGVCEILAYVEDGRCIIASVNYSGNNNHKKYGMPFFSDEESIRKSSSGVK